MYRQIAAVAVEIVVVTMTIVYIHHNKIDLEGLIIYLYVVISNKVNQNFYVCMLFIYIVQLQYVHSYDLYSHS